LFFLKELPYALFLGMTANEYWNDIPLLILSYEESYKIKQRIKQRKEQYLNEHNAWLAGFYNNRAIVSAFSKDVQYPNSLLFWEEAKKAEEERTLTIEQKRAKAEKEMKDYLMRKSNTKP